MRHFLLNKVSFLVVPLRTFFYLMLVIIILQIKRNLFDCLKTLHYVPCHCSEEVESGDGAAAGDKKKRQSRGRRGMIKTEKKQDQHQRVCLSRAPRGKKKYVTVITRLATYGMLPLDGESRCFGYIHKYINHALLFSALVLSRLHFYQFQIIFFFLTPLVLKHFVLNNIKHNNKSNTFFKCVMEHFQ